jgi:PEP-CTERM motif
VTGVLSMSEELVADGPRLRYDVIVAVPEPATLLLVLIGLGAFSVIGRKKASSEE